MGTYLRDAFISNVEVNEAAITKLAEKVVETIPPQSQEEQLEATFIIRFDGKGYRVSKIDDLLKHFRDAISIERILLTLEDKQSKGSNKEKGTALDIRFDKDNPANSSITVTANDKQWVETHFPAIQDIISPYKKRNGWVRTVWTAVFVQIVGVIFLFTLGVSLAKIVSKYINVADPFVVSLLFILLIFSNLWTHIYPRSMARLNSAFPNIAFRRGKEGVGEKIIMGIFIGIAVTFALWTLNWAGHLVFKMFTSLAKSG